MSAHGSRAQRGLGIVSLGALTVLLTQLVAGGSAFGAASVYTPGLPPPSALGGGFITVVTAQPVSGSGGTVTGSANGATATVTVPTGSLPNGGEVVISTGTPSTLNAGTGQTVVADFSIALVDPNTGLVLMGPFSPPISVTISEPSIAPGDSVVILYAPGQTTSVSGADVTQGQAVVTFTTDPNFAVVSSTTSTAPGVGSSTPTTAPGVGSSTPTSATGAVPNATSVVTGMPFLGEELLAGLLVLAGGAVLAIAAWRRRRRMA
jgi:hypothetical protein